MQFKVPQFLDIEDKIFGPFTFRQFVYLAGGAGLSFVIYELLGLMLGAIPIAIIVGFSGLLAFYRPNNKPFINMLEAGFKFLMQSKLYVWQKSRKTAGVSRESSEELKSIAMEQDVATPKLTSSKLRDLAWSLDVLDTNKGGEHATHRE